MHPVSKLGNSTNASIKLVVFCHQSRRGRTWNHTKGMDALRTQNAGYNCRTLSETFSFFLKCWVHFRVGKCSTIPTPELSNNHNKREKVWRIDLPNHKRDTAKRSKMPAVTGPTGNKHQAEPSELFLESRLAPIVRYFPLDSANGGLEKPDAAVAQQAFTSVVQSTENWLSAVMHYTVPSESTGTCFSTSVWQQ